jgi:hypothetical protein
MAEIFEDATVAGWEDLEDAVRLPDADDRPSLLRQWEEAPRRSSRSTSATSRRSEQAVRPRGDSHPDDFLLDQLELAPRLVRDVLHEQAAHTSMPALTAIDLAVRLARAGVPRFADEVGCLIYDTASTAATRS